MKFQSTLPARGATARTPALAPCEPISIHAPRTGSDESVFRGDSYYKDFNPRSPHGERRSGRDGLLVGKEFQSTLPARGATSDRWQLYHNCKAFQSTLPARGATRASSHLRRGLPISIHAPRTGSDNNGDEEPCVHAHFNPRSPHGERRTSATTPPHTRHFNPRSPHGERHCGGR